MSKNFDEVLKNAKPLSEDKVKAKAEKLKELMDMIGGGLGDQMKGLKKVTVASDSDEGLKKGLDLAKDKVEGVDDNSSPLHELEEKSESPAEEKSESPEMEKSEDAKIAELEKQLEELKSKKKGSDLASAKESLKSIF